MENPCFVGENDVAGSGGSELRRCRSLPLKQHQHRQQQQQPPYNNNNNNNNISTIYRPEQYSFENFSNLRRSLGAGGGGGGGGKEWLAERSGVVAGVGGGTRPGWPLSLGGAPGLGPQRRQATTLVSALLLATLITLAATAALVYLLRAVHSSYTPAPVINDQWTAEMSVSGEFTVTNEPYRPALENMTSTDFKQLATSIGQQVEALFKTNGPLREHFKSGSVVKFRVGPVGGASLVVHCQLLLHPTDPFTIKKVGLAFLQGLNLTHGHLWLGPYIVDVQSISFEASSEQDVTWSQWSNWSECQERSPDGKRQRRRKRMCLSLATGNRVPETKTRKKIGGSPCESGSYQRINDTEIENCPDEAVPMTTSTLSTIGDADRPEETLAPQAANSGNPLPEDQSQTNSSGAEVLLNKVTSSDVDNTLMDGSPNSTEAAERRKCWECAESEVCVAMEEELAPYCRPALDLNDPTGCGGLCKINTEVCYRLREGAFRCIDDSKCLDDEWQCENKLCIPLVKRCDGHFNCYDRTDEYNCECDLKLNFHCGKNSSCLPNIKKCDGIVDCWDAADEVNCTVACLDSAQFTCNDSQCIPSKNFCDSYADCNDRSDEPFGCSGVCKNHEWKCSNGRCILRSDICNGVDDCGDGSDEVKCSRKKNVF